MSSHDSSSKLFPRPRARTACSRTAALLGLFVAQPALAFMGGTPDGSYQWSTSAQTADPDAPLHSFVPYADLLANATNTTELNLSDDDTGLVSFAGAFTFYDASSAGSVTVSTIQVCSNGFISVQQPQTPGQPDIWCSYSPPPQMDGQGIADGIIAGLWTDLNPNDGGTISVFEDPTGVTVHWEQVPQFANPTQLETFQIRLDFDDGAGGRGDITIAYGDVSDMVQYNLDGSPLVGIEDAVHANALTVFDNHRASVLSNTTFRLSPCTAADCTLCNDGSPVAYHADGDIDDFGDSISSIAACFDMGPLGYITDGSDCDDTDPAINPLAAEVCDGIDQNCDGTADDGLPQIEFYRDIDDDGFGGVLWTTVCADRQPNGSVTDNTDCDDNDPSSFPGGVEVCDLADNDCNGTPDDGLTVLVQYVDTDDDGFGDPSIAATVCDGAPGYSTDNTDCDDSNPLINPSRVDDTCDEVDDNCDGTPDDAATILSWYTDMDEDGYGDPAAFVADDCAQPVGTASNALDCVDTDASISPDATEVCNGTDDNCDGNIDEGATSEWYADGDGDGFGSGVPVVACDGPAGTVPQGGDCNDGDNTVFPGATEVCNGADDNCDGTPDDGLTTQTWYTDSDNDGYGDAAAGEDCAQIPGTSALDGDCNDGNPAIHPNAIEQCDSIDNDCNGTVDDGVAETDWYPDGDGDGYGAGTPISDCAQPSGSYSPLDGDCDDANPNFNPDADEICDDLDNDCDGTVDDGLVFDNWYPDIDGDGFGAGTPVASCSTLNGHSIDGSDCDDGDPDIHPDADEICDSIDNDCDTLIDDGDDQVTGAPTWWIDDDGDTFGDDASSVQACTQPSGTANRSGDCNDADPDVYTGAPEACIDGKDNDCDTLIDDADPDFVFGGVEYGNDADGDGYGDPQAIEVACTGAQTTGYVPMSLGEDCDDGNPTAYPGYPEACDNVDNDCNGVVDEGLPFQDYYPDADGDFFGDPYLPPINACIRPADRVSNGLDCDDDDPDRNPNANEICDGIDQDCDLQIDEDLPTQDYYPDVDLDGFGDENATPESSCSPIDDMVLDSRDCDDSDPDVNPSAFDDPIDGFDANCDGVVEEIPPEPFVDSDGDGVVDIADGNPTQAGSAPSVDAPVPEYGCGCSASGISWTALFLPVLLVLRRR